MVARSGRGWRLAPSLCVLVDELDRLYPARDRRSDGSIGDANHSSSSDHSPHDGYVHAVDIDEDLAAGLDLKGFAADLVARRDPRMRYAIYEGRICKAYASNGYAPWTWQAYAGPSPHAHHLHLSISRTSPARNDLAAWWPERHDMSAASEQAIIDRLGRIEARLGGLDADVPNNLEAELDELRRNIRRIGRAFSVDGIE